jgi:HK97 gp10 family phage protein
MAEILGINELKRAIARNPEKVLQEGKSFLIRGLAVYKRAIINSPWRVGSNGGGAPVSNDGRYKRKYQRQRSGNLRDSHVTDINSLQASIGPNLSVAPYAKFVHLGTSRMRARPWLDYVKQGSDREVEQLYLAMLKNIVSDIAK